MVPYASSIAILYTFLDLYFNRNCIGIGEVS